MTRMASSGSRTHPPEDNGSWLCLGFYPPIPQFEPGGRQLHQRCNDGEGAVFSGPTDLIGRQGSGHSYRISMATPRTQTL